MVGINGIGGVPELANTKPGQVRDPVAPVAGSEVRADGVEISNAAQQVQGMARLLQLTEAQKEIRQKEVERARENIEQGTYRVVSVILQVAARVGKLVG